MEDERRTPEGVPLERKLGMIRTLRERDPAAYFAALVTLCEDVD